VAPSDYLIGLGRQAGESSTALFWPAAVLVILVSISGFIASHTLQTWLHLAENALGEFRIHSSIGKRWYFLRRNSGFQFTILIW